MCSFDSPAKNFAKGSKFRKLLYNHHFFYQSSCFSSPKSSGKMECKFNCLLNECLANPWKHVSQSRKTFMKKKHLIKPILFFPEKFFLGMQNKSFTIVQIFLENPSFCPKPESNKRNKKSPFSVQRPKAETNIKNSLQNYIFLRKVCGHVGWKFDDTAKNFSKISQKNPHQGPREI